MDGKRQTGKPGAVTQEAFPLIKSKSHESQLANRFENGDTTARSDA